MRAQVQAREQKIMLLDKIAEYLRGQGDPGILRLIEAAED